MPEIIIAIDGPAGSGKSTLARSLATKLGLPYVNTGLMFRALALAALRHGVGPEDAAGLATLAASIEFDLDPTVRPAELSIEGGRPDEDLMSPEVEWSVSAVARHPEVREVLRGAQRRLAAGGAVMEGRDIGTVVAPGADLKIFLQARSDERAVRRALERDAASEQVAEALGTRDAQDARINPFVPAPDAVVLDTSELTADQVLERVLDALRARKIVR